MESGGNEAFHRSYDLFCTHLPVVRKIGVAERTSQVATAEAHKDRRRTCMIAFALQRIEYLVDTIHHRIKTTTLNDKG